MNPKKAQYPFQLVAEFLIVSHSLRKTGSMTIELIEHKNISLISGIDPIFDSFSHEYKDNHSLRISESPASTMAIVEQR